MTTAKTAQRRAPTNGRARTSSEPEYTPPSHNKTYSELRREGVRVAGVSEGNLDVYYDTCVSIEGGIKHDPSPSERADWSERQVRQEAEIVSNKAQIRRNKKGSKRLAKERKKLQKRLDAGEFQTNWRDQINVVGACLLLVVLIGGLTALYSNVLYSALFDSSLLNALGSRGITEINRLIGSVITPGVFSSAMNEGGVSLVLLLLAFSWAMVYSGIAYYSRSDSGLAGLFAQKNTLIKFSFSIDVLMITVLEWKTYMTGLVDVSEMNVIYSVFQGAVMVLFLFSGYMTIGRLARWIMDVRAENYKRRAKARLKTTAKESERLRKENEELEKRISTARVWISIIRQRLDGHYCNYETTCVAIANFTAGFCQYVVATSETEAEANQRTTAIKKRKVEFLASVHDKYGIFTSL